MKIPAAVALILLSFAPSLLLSSCTMNQPMPETRADMKALDEDFGKDPQR